MNAYGNLQAFERLFFNEFGLNGTKYRHVSVCPIDLLLSVRSKINVLDIIISHKISLE
jgi:hypothetical protein